jgi:hypothetical protein
MTSVRTPSARNPVLGAVESQQLDQTAKTPKKSTTTETASATKQPADSATQADSRRVAHGRERRPVAEVQSQSAGRVPPALQQALGNVRSGLPPGYDANLRVIHTDGKAGTSYELSVKRPDGSTGKETLQWEALDFGGKNAKRLSESAQRLTQSGAESLPSAHGTAASSKEPGLSKEAQAVLDRANAGTARNPATLTLSDTFHLKEGFQERAGTFMAEAARLQEAGDKQGLQRLQKDQTFGRAMDDFVRRAEQGAIQLPNGKTGFDIVAPAVGEILRAGGTYNISNVPIPGDALQGTKSYQAHLDDNGRVQWKVMAQSKGLD